MTFHVQSLPSSDHGDFATFEEAQAVADAHPDDWLEISDLDTGARWVKKDGNWIVASLAAPNEADDSN